MESEFISAARGVQETMGCYYLVKELGMNMQLPMKRRMDNQTVITCIMNEASSSKTKHVDIKHKYIKDLYQRKIILPSYIPTIILFSAHSFGCNGLSGRQWEARSQPRLILML
jgi:hypothetical protein